MVTVAGGIWCAKLMAWVALNAAWIWVLMKATAIGNPLQPREMTRFEQWRFRLYRWFLWKRQRYIPYLVWYGDEVDVRVLLKDNKLRAADIGEALEDLHRGTFYKIERQLAEVGIEFDKGMGPDGRDWEWDWSLRGPISVTFRRRAKKPELRE